MTKLEAILKKAQSLSANERAELVAVLLQQAACDAETDEMATGQRGLAAWTESTQNESWAEFYPESLRNGRGKSS